MDSTQLLATIFSAAFGPPTRETFLSAPAAETRTGETGSHKSWTNTRMDEESRSKSSARLSSNTMFARELQASSRSSERTLSSCSLVWVQARTTQITFSKRGNSLLISPSRILPRPTGSFLMDRGLFFCRGIQAVGNLVRRNFQEGKTRTSATLACDGEAVQDVSFGFGCLQVCSM